MYSALFQLVIVASQPWDFKEKKNIDLLDGINVVCDNQARGTATSLAQSPVVAVVVVVVVVIRWSCVTAPHAGQFSVIT